LIAELPVALKASHQLTTERVADDAAFEGLQQEWDELLLASDSSCIFLTWEWLYTWWKHLAEDRNLFILAVRRGTELVALAPLGLRPQSLLQGRPFPVLEFLGSGFVGSDYLDVIVRKGNAPEVCQALAYYLSGRGVPLKWTNVKKEGSVAALLLDRLKHKRWAVAETQTNVCPFIPLRNSTWTTYLAGLSTEHRYNFNRKWRRLERDYKVRFEQIETGEQCREATDLLIAQHNARWRDRGGSDAFHTAGLVAFHREWTQLALNRGWLRLYQLRLDEKPAASLYGFLYRGIFYFYQSGFDDAYKQASVGLITMGLAIQSAIKEGAEEYDLLHGDESYKSHWCRHSRDLVRLESFPPGIRGTVCRVSIELGRVARRLRRVTVKEQAA
jgi:CelD/BcsL family acetyltransferase involved in cellulose biosynthesis